MKVLPGVVGSGGGGGGGALLCPRGEGGKVGEGTLPPPGVQRSGGGGGT